LLGGRLGEGGVRELLVRLTGQIEVGELLDHLRDTLSRGGFLENEVFEGIRAERHRSFEADTARGALHAGSAYPAEADGLRALLARYLADAPKAPEPVGSLVGIAAPHVSPEGGWRSYGVAYAQLRPSDRDRTFVVLGT